MGAKRRQLPVVQDAISRLSSQPGRLLDVFAGTGVVAAAEAAFRPVSCGDAMAFVGVLSRSRFLVGDDVPPRVLDAVISLAGRHYRRWLTAGTGVLIAEDDAALLAGQRATQEHIGAALHVGNSSEVREWSRLQPYALTQCYFARGYFSTRQAAQLDALRAAIDEVVPGTTTEVSNPLSVSTWRRRTARDVLLAAWIEAASSACSAPGHAAQHLRAASSAGYERVRRSWSLDVFETFLRMCRSAACSKYDTQRPDNAVHRGDAIAVLRSVTGELEDDTIVVYADPPYTKDQYSRYYHVFETMYLYDYPGAQGKGRVRPDRFQSRFNYKSQVAGAFEELFANSVGQGRALVLNYPSTGLLCEQELLVLAQRYGNLVWSSVSDLNSRVRRVGKPAPTAERTYAFSP